MKVILLADVPGVGNRHEIKDLKSGFAQNVLIARGLAVLATKSELAKLKNQKEQVRERKNEDAQSFKEALAKLKDREIIIKSKSNEKGHLFKAVGPKDIIKSVKENTGYQLTEKMIEMSNIKEVGIHKIRIKNQELVKEINITIE